MNLPYEYYSFISFRRLNFGEKEEIEILNLNKIQFCADFSFWHKKKNHIFFSLQLRYDAIIHKETSIIKKMIYDSTESNKERTMKKTHNEMHVMITNSIVKFRVKEAKKNVSISVREYLAMMRRQLSVQSIWKEESMTINEWMQRLL